MLTSTLPRWPGDSTPRFVLDLAIQLVRLGWRIDVLAPGHRGAKPSEIVEGVGIHRFTYAVPRSWQTLCYGGGILPNIRANPLKLALVPSFMGAALLASRRLAARLKPDIVHAHWIVPMGLIGAAAAPRRTPLVVTIHGSDALDLRGGLLSRLKSGVLRRADAITCNGSKTEAAASPLAGASRKLTRIPMGASARDPDIRHGLELDSNRFHVLFAGRLFRGKGLDDLLDAIAGFEPGSRPHVLVAGTGPETDRFKAKASALNIARDVEFLGGIEHRRLLALMAAVNAVVMPTRTNKWVEAQGLVVAEAMLAGTPVIGTTGGGAEDHIVHDVTGLLVPPAAPTALGAALRHVISRPDHARQMAEAASLYARKALTWESSAFAFDRVYRRLLPVNGNPCTTT
jgi:glycosyltransferase involved in cell wall biosynthesis